MKFPDKDTLRDRYENLSDEQLMDILRAHNDYQEQAVEVAVDIAIKRNLITSRDLLSKLPVKKTGWQPFPELKSTIQLKKTIKSIHKILYLFTFSPVIAAILNHASGKTAHVIFYCIIALSWGVATWISAHKKDSRIIYLHFALFILLIAFAIKENSIAAIDKLHLFIYVIFFFVVIYLLLFLRILLKKKATS